MFDTRPAITGRVRFFGREMVAGFGDRNPAWSTIGRRTGASRGVLATRPTAGRPSWDECAGDLTTVQTSATLGRLGRGVFGSTPLDRWDAQTFNGGVELTAQAFRSGNG
jgi:hypothetical protein